MLRRPKTPPRHALLRQSASRRRVGDYGQLFREMIPAVWELSRLLQERDLPSGELNHSTPGMSREIGGLSRADGETNWLDRRWKSLDCRLSFPARDPHTPGGDRRFPTGQMKSLTRDLNLPGWETHPPTREMNRSTREMNSPGREMRRRCLKMRFFAVFGGWRGAVVWSRGARH